MAPALADDLGILMVALVAHFILSIIYAVILGWIVARMGLGPAVLTGLAVGLALYLVNFYGFTAVFPWSAMARNWVSVVAHLVFGGVTGRTYKTFEEPEARPAGAT